MPRLKKNGKVISVVLELYNFSKYAYELKYIWIHLNAGDYGVVFVFLLFKIPVSIWFIILKAQVIRWNLEYFSECYHFNK